MAQEVNHDMIFVHAQKKPLGPDVYFIIVLPCLMLYFIVAVLLDDSASSFPHHFTSCSQRSLQIGDPAVGDMGCYLHLAWNSTRAVGGPAGEAARGAGGRGRRNGAKNKPNNPGIESCGKLWQLFGMWAVICIWRAIPVGD